MQSKPALRLTQLDAPHNAALRAVVGEPGVAGVVVMLLGVGAGLALDFLVFHVHPLFSAALSVASAPIALYWTLYRTLSMDRRSPNPDYMRNLALATVAGQSGCMTVILIFMGLFTGMYLDSRLDTHPVFTIGLLFAAIPLSLYAMIRLMLSSVAAIHHPPAAGGTHAASPDSADNPTKKEISS